VVFPEQHQYEFREKSRISKMLSPEVIGRWDRCDGSPSGQLSGWVSVAPPAAKSLSSWSAESRHMRVKQLWTPVERQLA
jgi:hypothetical protein